MTSLQLIAVTTTLHVLDEPIYFLIYIRMLAMALELTWQLVNTSVAMTTIFLLQSLTKPPESYPDAKSLPHVLVAQRLISKGTRVQAGDVVPYVICCNTSEVRGRGQGMEDCTVCN